MDYSLKDLGLVDAPPAQEYDNLTKLATQLIGTPVALVSVVDFDNDRQFFKSQIGLPEPWATDQQTPLSHSFCQHVVNQNAALVVSNALEDPLVRDNLAIPDLGVIAYLGVPFYTPNNKPAGALCVIQGEPRNWTKDEITSLKMLADCVSDTIRLKAALLTSEQLHKDLHDFTYAISHDLKSPTNTMNFLLTELSSETLSEDGRFLLNNGIATSERMAQQIDDIVAYTRTVKSDNDMEEVDLKILVDNIAADLAFELNTAQAKLKLNDLPKINGNPFQLKSLFQNLIENAVKFRHPDRTPVISVTAQVSPNGRCNAISVSDNGIGIEAENQEKIFDLFGRLHVREEYPGTGVGLALCKRVCLNHNGTLSVNSTQGESTVFTANLPRQMS